MRRQFSTVIAIAKRFTAFALFFVTQVSATKLLGKMLLGIGNKVAVSSLHAPRLIRKPIPPPTCGLHYFCLVWESRCFNSNNNILCLHGHNNCFCFLAGSISALFVWKTKGSVGQLSSWAWVSFEWHTKMLVLFNCGKDWQLHIFFELKVDTRIKLRNWPDCPVLMAIDDCETLVSPLAPSIALTSESSAERRCRQNLSCFVENYFVVLGR